MRVSPRLALVWTLLGCLGLSWLSVAAAAPPAAELAAAPLSATNLITNPSFEGDEGWQGAAGGASGFVAPGWNNWFIVGPDANIGYLKAPEWLPEDIWAQRSHMVLHGQRSQKMFSTSATHDAGNWQTITGLTPGQPVEFSVWVKQWSSDCGDACISPMTPCRPDSSNTHGEYTTAVGIDPTGAQPSVPGAPPATVQWTEWNRVYDAFVRLSIRVTPTSDRVTVYTRGTAKWRVQNNFSFWDDAELRVLDDTATPTPTSTTFATVTPQPTATRTPTAPPGPTMTPTASATPGEVRPHAYLPYLVVGYALPATPTPTATAPAMATATATATATLIPSTETPTSTPTTTSVPPTETPTPTASPTPTATATQVPIVCADPVINGNFEGVGGWQFETGVPYPAGIDDTVAHGGVRSLRLGPAGTAVQESWSYAWQPVSIPAGATSVSLSFWVYREGGDANDEIEVELMTAQGVPVRKLLRSQPAEGAWQQVTADLSVWAGSTVQLWFNAYNDGEGDTLTAHVDDVRLEACGPIDHMGKASPGLDPEVKLGAPRPPARKTRGANVHFTWVRYSPEQIYRSRYCPECDIEWSYMVNDGDAMDMGGWTVVTQAGNRFTFPSFVVQPGDAIRLWTGTGVLTRTQLDDFAVWDVYWGSTVGLLANAHDDQSGRLILTDPQGRQPAVSICWGPNQQDPGGCPTP